MDVLIEEAELHRTGDDVTASAGRVGSLRCVECGYALTVAAFAGELPRCPACGGSDFRRASLFEQPTDDAEALEPSISRPAWLAEVRLDLEESGAYLAYAADGEEPVVRKLDEGWIRIGRSRAADLRLDCPTVSRRHALVIHTPEGKLRALDDRSLNGLYVNGSRLEWTELSDGDELEIGRYRLFVLEV